MRFKRPSQPVAAIRCPSCRQIFEVDSASLLEEPIVAQVIEEKPVAVVAVEVEEVVVPSQVTAAIPIQPQPSTVAPLRPVLPHKNKSAKKVQKPHNPAQKKQALLFGSIAIGLILCSVAAFYATKFLNSRSQPDKLIQLANRFEKNLDGVRKALASHQNNPNNTEVNSEVLALRDLLIACVNTETIPDAEFGSLNTELNRLSDLQTEVRRLSNQLAPSFDKTSLVDQLPSMIELINKQLNYGIRRPRQGREQVDQFYQRTFSMFRKLDKVLGNSLRSGDFRVEEIGQRIEELDQQIISFSQSTESRVELGFENKQILESGSAWRSWCLRQLQLSGRSTASLAVSRELDELAIRFDLALKASAVEAHSLSAIDRLNQRMNSGSATVAEKSTSTINSSSLDTNSSNKQLSISPRNSAKSFAGSSTSIQPTSPNTTSPSSSGLASSESLPVESRPSNASVSSTPASSPPTANLLASDDAITPKAPQSSSGSSNVESQSMPLGSGLLVFPQARYQGPGTLTIKVVTRKSKAELQQIGTQIASRIGGVVDLQLNDNLATLSFSNYSGKIYDVVKHLDFGKVEISDTQSRTLFVNDSE